MSGREQRHENCAMHVKTHLPSSSRNQEERTAARKPRKDATPLTRMDLVLSIAKRYPSGRQRDRLIELLRAQTVALKHIGETKNISSTTRTPSTEMRTATDMVSNNGSKKEELDKLSSRFQHYTNMDLLEVIAERFPSENDRERMVAFMNSQTLTLKQINRAQSESSSAHKKKAALSSPKLGRPAVSSRPKIVSDVNTPSHSSSTPNMRPFAKPPHQKEFLRRIGLRDFSRTPCSSKKPPPKPMTKDNTEVKKRTDSAKQGQQTISKLVPVCQFCFQEIRETPRDKQVVVSECSAGHTMCSACLRCYVGAFVAGGTFPLHVDEGFKALSCMSSECLGGHIPHREIRRVCSDDIWIRYQEKIFNCS